MHYYGVRRMRGFGEICGVMHHQKLRNTRGIGYYYFVSHNNYAFKRFFYDLHRFALPYNVFMKNIFYIEISSFQMSFYLLMD